MSTKAAKTSPRAKLAWLSASLSSMIWSVGSMNTSNSKSCEGDCDAGERASEPSATVTAKFY